MTAEEGVAALFWEMMLKNRDITYLFMRKIFFSTSFGVKFQNHVLLNIFYGQDNKIMNHEHISFMNSENYSGDFLH